MEESVLSKFDDYPIHQTPEPVAQPASSDRNVYDRYWFNGFQDDGGFYFAIGAAIYPNLGIMDCGFSIVRDGEQHSFHASRRAPKEPSETCVGPFRIDVVDPMRRVRVILDDNETGIAADLTFTARTAAVEEGRQTLRQGGRLFMDVTRFAQFGRWQGEIRYDGQTVRVDEARVFGVKDRSWGIRPVGAPDPGKAPPEGGGGQIFFLWAPIHWRDRCTHFGVFENGDAHRWHSDGAFVPVYDSLDAIPGAEDPGIERMASVEHDIEYVPGTRLADRAKIALVEKSGARTEIELEPLLCFRMKGIGYTHPEWGHGLWKGELAIGGESWKCDSLDPLAFDNQHVQLVVRAVSGGEQGIGVMEQLSLGPHARYGFEGFLDPAR
jgi:hypothetical protein